MTLDPEVCRGCGRKGRVAESRRVAVKVGETSVVAYRRRRHVCTHGCTVDLPGGVRVPRRWTSYQSRFNPKFVAQVRVREATT
jgi:hypothetical protein